MSPFLLWLTGLSSQQITSWSNFTICPLLSSCEAGSTLIDSYVFAGRTFVFKRRRRLGWSTVEKIFAGYEATLWKLWCLMVKLTWGSISLWGEDVGSIWGSGLLRWAKRPNYCFKNLSIWVGHQCTHHRGDEGLRKGVDKHFGLPHHGKKEKAHQRAWGAWQSHQLPLQWGRKKRIWR